MTFVSGRGAGVLREFLDRFRRSGGVPTQVTDDVAAELAPLFATLDGLDGEAAVVRDQAARRAADLDSMATLEAERILGDAQLRAEEERRRMVDDACTRATAEVDAILSQAAAQADRIRSAGNARLPTMVAHVISCVEAGGR